MAEEGKITFWSATTIGLGGMIGGSIFAVLGLSVELARGGTPLAFLLAGLVALITSYSYAKLSIHYPSQGGTVEFINQAFGISLFAGTANVLLWLSYIFLASLYAYAVGTYAATFFPHETQSFWRHVLLSVCIVLFAIMNLTSVDMVARAQRWIIALTVVIFLFFIIAGVGSIQWDRLMPVSWADPLPLVAGGMIIFVAYEGFELIGNTCRDCKNAPQTIPRAFYAAVGTAMVLYILVSMVAVGNMTVGKITLWRDYALAESAGSFAGKTGFAAIVIAAVLSSGSAVNATLYGTMRVIFTTAKEGQLPMALKERKWRRSTEGLLITSAGALLVANLVNVSGMATMGSAGFLLLFAAVNASNYRLFRETGSVRWIPGTGVVLCLISFVMLTWQRAMSNPWEISVLVALIILAFAIEAVYLKFLASRTARVPPKDKVE